MKPARKQNNFQKDLGEFSRSEETVLPFSRKFPFLRKFYCRKGKSKEIKAFFENLHRSTLIRSFRYFLKFWVNLLNYLLIMSLCWLCLVKNLFWTFSLRFRKLPKDFWAIEFSSFGRQTLWIVCQFRVAIIGKWYMMLNKCCNKYFILNCKTACGF